MLLLPLLLIKIQNTQPLKTDSLFSRVGVDFDNFEKSEANKKLNDKRFINGLEYSNILLFARSEGLAGLLDRILDGS